MYCSNCGAKLKDDMKFCESCGTKIESTQYENNEGAVVSTERKTGKVVISKKALIGIVGVGLIVIIGLFFMFNGSNNDTPKEAVESFMKGVLNEDVDLFLDSIYEKNVKELEMDFDRDNDGRFDNFEEAVEELVLYQMQQGLKRQGIDSLSDIKIIQPDDYKSKTRVEVTVMMNGEDEELPVVKIEDKWYVDFDLY